MKEVACLFPELSEKRPVVGRGVSNDLQVGQHSRGRLRRRAAPSASSGRAPAPYSTFSGECSYGNCPSRWTPGTLPRPRRSGTEPRETAQDPPAPFPPRAAASSIQRLPALVNKRLRHDGFMPPNLRPCPQACSSAGEGCRPPGPVRKFKPRLSSTGENDGLSGDGTEERDRQRGFSTRWISRKTDRPGEPDRRSRLRRPSTGQPTGCFPTSKAANAPAVPAP